MGNYDGILLYSGGLDSLLAARILIDQGLKIAGFHCVLPFVSPQADCTQTEIAAFAREIGLDLVFHRCGEEYIEMLKNPPHGYGKNINPCIDCHIFFLKKAAEYMRETGARFIATGEVVGQRPMSQLKNTLLHIIKESGLEGRLLRPLSARILPETIPEREGFVDREKLHAISGRGRSKQLELAAKYGIKSFSSPAGGCLFTDPNISKRIRDLLASGGRCSETDIFLASVGRHFRLSSQVRIIVGRNEDENSILQSHAGTEYIVFEPEFPGPVILAAGEGREELKKLIVAVAARYGKHELDGGMVGVFRDGKLLETLKAVSPISDTELNRLRI